MRGPLAPVPPSREGRASRRLLLPALLLALAAVPDPSFPGAAASPGELQALLAGLGRASRLYLDSALQFSCRETILENGPDWKQRHRFEYIYVYDDKKGFVDYRTRLGDIKHRPVSPVETGVRLFLERSYFWALIFSPPRQRFHRYGILGRGKLLHRDAVRLHFEAIPPFREGVNQWTGTAWVDLRTLQLLKVDAERADLLAEKSRIEEGSAVGDRAAPAPGSLITTQRAVTEFSVEKNGMRFPGRVQIQKTFYRIQDSPAGRDPLGASLRINERTTLQTYSRYRFFGVRTREEIQGIVSGVKPPGVRR